MDPGATDLPSRSGPMRHVAAKVAEARETLRSARSALDSAVAALPDVAGDEAMATPTLLLLLCGAVKAKERLCELEAQLASNIG